MIEVEAVVIISPESFILWIANCVMMDAVE
jgi:hypothetical protein